MIKLFALIFMLIDHIGLIFFPQYILLRIIGRLSMPLYAYCIARGFFYTNKNGTLYKYIRNMAILAMASQIPFSIMIKSFYGIHSYNICFTWLLAILLLFGLFSYENSFLRGCSIGFSICLGLFVPIDYGIYGILYPLIIYYCLFYRKSIGKLFIYSVLLFLFGVYISQNIIQLFAIFTIPLLLLLQKCDDKVKINKLFYYLSYPVHISILLIIYYLIT